MCREHCIKKGTHHFKDLRAIKNVGLDRMIIVDNMVISFAAQLENGIYIPSYTGQENDNELETVGQFLAEIAEVGDVRPYVTKFAGIKELYDQFCCKSNGDKKQAKESFNN